MAQLTVYSIDSWRRGGVFKVLLLEWWWWRSEHFLLFPWVSELKKDVSFGPYFSIWPARCEEWFKIHGTTVLDASYNNHRSIYF